MRKLLQSRAVRLTLIWTGIAAAFHYTTPNPAPFFIIALIIAYFGEAILGRLAFAPKQDGLQGVAPDCWATFLIDNVLEEKFSVWLVDGTWEVERSFSLWGPIIREPDDKIADLTFNDRTGITIYPTANGLQKAEIGRIQANPHGGCTVYVGLPYDMARHVLEDVRREKKQIVTIGFKRPYSGQDNRIFPVYSFELDEYTG